MYRMRPGSGPLLDCYVKATQLLIDIFEDPQGTGGSGLALLQCCCDGYPVEMLRPLLRSHDPYLQSTGAFVASELGRDAAPLLDDAIRLLNVAGLRTQADAMDVVAVCATEERIDRYVALLALLDDPDPATRQLAGRLVANASAAQRAVARRYFDELGRPDDAARWGAPPTEHGR